MIKINNKTYKIPQTWNDLTLKQQLYCYTVAMGNLNYFEVESILPTKRIECAKHLLNLDDKFLKEWENDAFQAYPETGNTVFLTELKEVSNAMTDFLFEKVPGKENEYQIALTLTQCPYPKFQYKTKNKKKKILFAPADEFENMTIYELGTSFTIFEAYLETKNEALVNQLLATIFRPHKRKTRSNKAKSYEGDRRLPLLEYEATISKRAEHLEKMPIAAKQLLLFWFASCRQHIIRSYPNIFEKPKAGKKIGNDYGWSGVLMELADGLVHLDEISKQNYANAFTRLSYLEDQRKLAELRNNK